MRDFKKLIVVLVFILLAGTVFLFLLENQQVARVSFMGVVFPELPLSVYIVSALGFGLLLSPVVGRVSSLFRSRRG